MNYFEVKDKEIANLFVGNILTVYADPDEIMEMVKEKNQEDKYNLELTLDEWDTLNTVIWHVYEKLNARCETTTSILEKSAIEKFMDTFESVVEKVNEMAG